MKIYPLIVSVLISSSAYSQIGLQESFSKILNTQVHSGSDPGLSIGVVKDGELIYRGNRGSMNLEYDLPINSSTVFGLASVTKQFTSACIGILEKKGELSVNDDVRKYIPELTAYSDTIRIEHLLNHTSGIRNHNVLLNLSGFDYEHQGYTNKMIEELMFRQRGLNNAPGEKMLYSNTNYVLLALIVERVSGIPIHEFAKQEIFLPLQMSGTFYKSNLQEIIENQAYPYYKNSDQYLQPKSLTLCVGAGGMVSTIQDLAKWAKVFLDPDHEFSFLKNFITYQDTLNSGKLMTHGRGMFVSPYKGYTTFNHSGRDLGMRSQFICIPEKDLAIIVLTNFEDISYRILDLFVKDNIEKKEKQKEHFPNHLNKFRGTYQELNSDLRMEIFSKKDTLKAISSFGRSATPLVPKTANSFYRLDSPSIVYTFYSEEGSEVDLEVDFGGAIFYFERVQLESNPNQNLNDYTGNYYSDELDVNYTLSLENNNLSLSYPNNENIILTEGVKDTFGANRRTKYSFNRNIKGKVVSFEVASEGTVKEILFKKIN